MTEASKQVPPVPDAFPLLRGDLATQDPNKLASHPWARWFLALREKVNAINAALVNLGVFANNGGQGITVLQPNGEWAGVTIEGTPGRVSVANGDGIGGNPTIDIEGVVRNISVLNDLTLDDSDPENLVLSVDPLFISRNQVAAQWVPVPLTSTSPGSVGDISMDADYFYTCEGTNVWKRTARATW